MTKQGVSLIISWVLLIGFAVTLGIIVSQWMQEQAEHTATTVIDEKAREMTCRDVALNAFLSPSCDTINISNKGLFTIHEINIRSQFGTEPLPTLIPPHQSQNLNIRTSLSPEDSIEVIPVIQMEKTNVPCVTRKTTTTC